MHGSVSDEVLHKMPSLGLGVSRRKRKNGEKSSTDDELFIFCEVALFINTAYVIQSSRPVIFSASSTEVPQLLILENYEV